MVQPIKFPEQPGEDFWRAYLAWQAKASDAELEQLEQALSAIQSEEVLPIATAIRRFLKDEQGRRALPATLVERLSASCWPQHAATA